MKRGKRISVFVVVFSLFVFVKAVYRRFENRENAKFVKNWPSLNPYTPSLRQKILANRFSEDVKRLNGWKEATSEDILAPTSNLIRNLPEVDR